MSTDYTLVLTLTITGLPSEAEANYVRDHITMLAKMASYDVRARATIAAPAEGEPSE